MVTRSRLLPFLDQINQGLIDACLKLPSFALCQAPHSGQDFGIDLGREFLTADPAIEHHPFPADLS